MTIAIDYELCCWKDGRCTSTSSESSCCEDTSSKSICCGDSNDANECEGCAEVCPTGAIARENRVEIDDELCIDCGVCIDACPHGALAME